MASPPACNFRRRIIADLARTFLLPPLIISVSARLLHLRFGWWSLPVYLLSILLAATARVQWIQLVQRREAEQLGARAIPCVVGKWPGNIDVMLRVKKAFASSYIYNPYVELFEEHQSTTLNTRFLWMDNVSILSVSLHGYVVRYTHLVQHRSSPWTKNIPNTSSRQASIISGAGPLNESGCKPSSHFGIHMSSRSCRENFLGDGIFNRDDQACIRFDSL